MITGDLDQTRTWTSLVCNRFCRSDTSMIVMTHLETLCFCSKGSKASKLVEVHCNDHWSSTAISMATDFQVLHHPSFEKNVKTWIQNREIETSPSNSPELQWCCQHKKPLFRSPSGSNSWAPMISHARNIFHDIMYYNMDFFFPKWMVYNVVYNNQLLGVAPKNHP